MTPNINSILRAPDNRRNSRFGAPMGCANKFDPDYPKLYVQRIRFVNGDYGAGGTYWGGNSPLWCGFSLSSPNVFASCIYVRADDRRGAIEAIRELYPDVTFHQPGQATRLLWASFNRLELSMTLSQARSAYHAGQCDEDVEVIRVLPAISAQLKEITDENLAFELREYGAWDAEELKDRVQNERRIVWLAGGNIVEETK